MRPCAIDEIIIEKETNIYNRIHCPLLVQGEISNLCSLNVKQGALAILAENDRAHVDNRSHSH